jgi:hypothetical protein
MERNVPGADRTQRSAEGTAPERRGLFRGSRTARELTLIFGSVGIVTVMVLIGTSYWAGLFDSIQLAQRRVGPYSLLYREHRGPYQGMRLVMRETAALLKETYGREPRRGFGIYYDDPATVDAAELRSIGGCITDTLIAEPGGAYRSRVFEETDAVVGTFRLRSLFSYMVGVQKFYPALETFLEKGRLRQVGPVMEIYDLDREEILFIAPLAP